MNDASRNGVRERHGSLGELVAAGTPVVANLVFHGWRPFLGSEVVTLRIAGGSVTVTTPANAATTALVEYCNATYGTTLSTADAAASADTAAHIVWANDLQGLPMSRLPEVSS